MNAAKRLHSEDSIYSEIAAVVQRETGVQLGSKQRLMVETRMRRHLSEQRLKTIFEYWDRYLANPQVESKTLVSLLTTHHTFFFRESKQFDFFLAHLLPSRIAAAKARGDKKIRIWSAACSQGHEVYSLAMFLDHHLKGTGVGYEVVGSDVDPVSVKIATNGVYRYQDLKEVPMQYISDKWARGSGDIKDFVKAKENIKSNCKFRVASLLDPIQTPTEKFDAIFCRNVFIYFTPSDVKKAVQGLMKNLDADGTLFLGISESLNGMDLPLTSLGNAIYQAKGIKKAEPIIQKPIRVICVDDSPSVISILKRVLNKESGFEIVATASNGIEAAKVIKSTPCDVVTLDIHMPEMDGLQYLKTHYGPNHPPVIIVSSVSRDDQQMAHTLITSGARDYVEKPTLANLKDVTEELHTKLRTAITLKPAPSNISQADKEFSRVVKVSSPDKCLRILSIQDTKFARIEPVLKQWKTENVPLLCVIGQMDLNEQLLLSQFMMSWSKQPAESAVGTPLFNLNKPGTWALKTRSEAEKEMGSLAATIKTVSIVAVGSIDQNLADLLCDFSTFRIHIEETASNLRLELSNSDMVPFTSLAYNSTDYLSRVK